MTSTATMESTGPETEDIEKGKASLSLLIIIVVVVVVVILIIVITTVTIIIAVLVWRSCGAEYSLENSTKVYAFCGYCNTLLLTLHFSLLQKWFNGSKGRYH